MATESKRDTGSNDDHGNRKLPCCHAIHSGETPTRRGTEGGFEYRISALDWILESDQDPLSQRLSMCGSWRGSACIGTWYELSSRIWRSFCAPGDGVRLKNTDKSAAFSCSYSVDGWFCSDIRILSQYRSRPRIRLAMSVHTSRSLP